MKITYEKYNNKDMTTTLYRDTIEEALKVKEKLSTLEHITKITIEEEEE